MLRTKQGIFSGVTLCDIGVASNLWFCRNHSQMGGRVLTSEGTVKLTRLVHDPRGMEGRSAQRLVSVRSLINDQVATTCWELCWGPLWCFLT